MGSEGPNFQSKAVRVALSRGLDLLIEGTKVGLARAKAQGKVPGRPPALSADQQQAARGSIDNGEAVCAIANEFRTSRQTIMRIRDHA